MVHKTHLHTIHSLTHTYTYNGMEFGFQGTFWLFAVFHIGTHSYILLPCETKYEQTWNRAKAQQNTHKIDDSFVCDSLSLFPSLSHLINTSFALYELVYLPNFPSIGEYEYVRAQRRWKVCGSENKCQAKRVINETSFAYLYVHFCDFICIYIYISLVVIHSGPFWMCELNYSVDDYSIAPR